MTVGNVLCASLLFLGVFSIFAPVLQYLWAGWEAKRRDILDGLSEDARFRYFEMFRRDGHPPAKARAFDEFEVFYRKWYGRKFFAFPLVLLLISTATVAALEVFTILHRTNVMRNPLFDLPDPAIAALAGAYMWVVDDLVSRARRLDFSPSDLLWANLRLIIAVPMGYAFAAVVTEPLAPFIAFALGAFPLATLTSMLRRLAVSKLSIDTASEQSPDGILKLQGINRTVVERLYNEDISTVPQLAWCDPVRLTMRSNLTFNFVIDSMSQALAWVYFEDGLEKIRILGMRSAVEIGNVIDDLDQADATGDADQQAIERVTAILERDADTDRLSLREEYFEPGKAGAAIAHRPDNAARARARSVLADVAKALNQDPATVENTFREIAGDPYTKFITAVWRDIGEPEAKG